MKKMYPMQRSENNLVTDRLSVELFYDQLVYVAEPHGVDAIEINVEDLNDIIWKKNNAILARGTSDNRNVEMKLLHSNGQLTETGHMC